MQPQKRLHARIKLFSLMLATTFKRSTSLWHYGLPIDLPLDDALDAVINQFLIKRSRRPDAEGDLITKIHDEPTTSHVESVGESRAMLG